MPSTDESLARLQAEFERKQTAQQQAPSISAKTDDLFAEVKAEFEQQQDRQRQQRQPPAMSNDPSLDNQLARVKSELKAKGRSQPSEEEVAKADKGLAELKAQFQERSVSQSPESGSSDDKLAELRAQFAHKQKASSSQSPQAAPTEDELAKIKAKFAQSSQSSKAAPTEDRLAEIKAQFAQQRKSVSKTGGQGSTPPQASAQTDNLLSQIKDEFQQKTVTVQEGKTEDFVQEVRAQRLAEQQRQQRRKAIQKKALAWLQELDLQSEEGLWFEEFAYSYPSRLEAAVDYLQALSETRDR